MAITIEGFSVVAQRARIQHLLEREAFAIPNSTALSDAHLWKCSFMAHVDALKFLRTLEELGLNVSQGPDSSLRSPREDGRRLSRLRIYPSRPSQGSVASSGSGGDAVGCPGESTLRGGGNNHGVDRSTRSERNVISASPARAP